MAKKIRMRDRQGYVKEAGGYTSWTEFQVVDGRKVIARFDFLGQAKRAHPDAWVPPELEEYV